MTTHEIVMAICATGALIYAAFLLGYGTSFPWWRGWEGRALVTSSAAWVLVLGHLFVDEWHNVPDLVWLAVGIVVILGGLFKLVLLVRAFRAHVRADDRAES